MSKVFIIAEAGVNHNGSLDIAKQLVDKAVEAGVDAVKFQTFRAENIVCKAALKAEYQMNTTDTEESQFDMLKKLELSSRMHEELLQYCIQKNIQFLSTPFDIDSVEYLDKLGISIMKVPSGEITNYPYLKKIGETKKKVIISTGMSDLREVEDAIKVLCENGSEEIVVLHCNTEYPTPYEDVNLKAMITLKERLNVEVGYSDHTLGIEIPIAAVTMGASVIEKHFTLDKNMEGPDHKASLEPEELKAMTLAIRNVEKALGTGIKVPSDSEKKNLAIARKSIVAKKKIFKGDLYTEDNLTTKRPGNGISPMHWEELIGKTANKEYNIDELIEL